MPEAGALIQRTADLLWLADLHSAAADVLRPVEVLRPSAWAERYRHVDMGPFRGAWDNANGPHLVAIMDAVQEAMETGRNLVVMKGAQEGVTEALGLNAVCWLLHYYGGPILYLTAKDDTAKKLSRQRWEPTLRTCEPLRRKHLAGKAQGELILSKRFTDGSLDMCGSRSMNNYISNPYAIVVFDEIDACQSEMADGADPVATIEERMTAFAEGRPVLLIAFAHPTTRERGAARLYYELSDQRRAHVRCPHCAAWWAPQWKTDVQVVARAGQSQAQAERDPSCYELVHAACGAVISDADRLRMIEHVEQRSTLPLEVAAAKPWIGLHVWHLFLRKAGNVQRLARKYAAAIDNPGAMVTFVNKTTGDAYDFADQETTAETWKALQVESYRLGEVPPDVSFLTGGQDSRLLELHWAAWGWGLVRTAAGVPILCGYLIDCRVEPGPAAVDRSRTTLDAADLHVFDQVLYDRTWRRQGRDEHLEVRQAFHDSGWQPIAAYEFCRTRPGRAFPSKGAAVDDASRAPAVAWAPAPKWRINDEEVCDPDLKRADLNTFLLKVDFVGQATQRFSPAGGGPPRARLFFPADTPPEFFQHMASERLVSEGGRKVWKRRGPNHWLDCTIQAYAAALQLVPFLHGVTRDEHLAKVRAEGEARAQRQLGGEAGPAQPVRRPVHRRPIRRRY